MSGMSHERESLFAVWTTPTLNTKTNSQFGSRLDVAPKENA